MFDRLAGNQRVKDVLRRMLAARRVPGAMLFAGEEGVGKKLFALEVAKAFNCRSPKGAEACDACPSCLRTMQFVFPATDDKEAIKRVVWSGHADVGIVRPYGRFLLVAQMRDIEHEANFRPYEGAARVFIIEDADRLNEASSNALLKTLEEPPSTSYLILTTSRPATLLPTIRSRCQMIRFSPLAPAEIEAHLTREKRITKADASLLARVSRGSLGRALNIDLNDYRQQREAMMELLGALALTVDRTRLLRAAEELNDAKRKEEYEPRLDVLETLVRDLWTLTLGASRERLVNEDLHERLSPLSARLTSERAARWLSRIETLRDQLSVNINRKVATDALLLSMVEE
ncbi:MAG TPA: DNA polymerase III subunit delta' [Pyrinomonadaceae bacterium]|jgi:DNA polymerase-3 subunit delta'